MFLQQTFYLKICIDFLNKTIGFDIEVTSSRFKCEDIKTQNYFSAVRLWESIPVRKKLRPMISGRKHRYSCL